jgi:pyruvate formate lyase activating enzyme
MEKTAHIFNIQRCSTEDGPGLRTTLFMKGCPMRCAWCHNPEGLSPAFNIMWIESKCQGCRRCVETCPNEAITTNGAGLMTDPGRCRLCGSCVEACLNNSREISGRDISVTQAVDTVKRDKIFYSKSGGGVTISGGEACLQWEFAREFLKACKALDIHTATDTCGFVKRENLASVLEYSDMVLYDLKVADPALHKKYTGVDLALVLENAGYISDLGIPMWIRIPIVPGYTDTPENINGLGAIIKGLSAVVRVDLLSYHRLGEAKYKGLGMIYPMEEGLASPLKSQMEDFSGIIKKMLKTDVVVTCS